MLRLRLSLAIAFAAALSSFLPVNATAQSREWPSKRLSCNPSGRAYRGHITLLAYSVLRFGEEDGVRLHNRIVE